MDVPAKNIPVNRFFASADKPPGNVWVMRVRPTQAEPGLCQNVNDESFWHIDGDRWVRLIGEHEYDKTDFRL